ncbi:MAG: hypothetical protein WD407_13630 [Rhodospirillales bacterium]
MAERGKIKKTKKLDTGKLKRYLHHILDHWPLSFHESFPVSFPEPNPDR